MTATRSARKARQLYRAFRAFLLDALKEYPGFAGKRGRAEGGERRNAFASCIGAKRAAIQTAKKTEGPKKGSRPFTRAGQAMPETDPSAPFGRLAGLKPLALPQVLIARAGGSAPAHGKASPSAIGRTSGKPERGRQIGKRERCLPSPIPRPCPLLIRRASVLLFTPRGACPLRPAKKSPPPDCGGGDFFAFLRLPKPFLPSRSSPLGSLLVLSMPF